MKGTKNNMMVTRRQKQAAAAQQKRHTFPWILHCMLDAAEKEGFDHIVSWLSPPPNSSSSSSAPPPTTINAFKVHDIKAFIEIIMPYFFNQSRYKSFLRQLNLYCFTRNSKGGQQRGSYEHPLFIRGQRELCKYILRVQNKTKALLITKNRSDSVLDFGGTPPPPPPQDITTALSQFVGGRAYPPAPPPLTTAQFSCNDLNELMIAGGGQQGFQLVMADREDINNFGIENAETVLNQREREHEPFLFSSSGEMPVVPLPLLLPAQPNGGVVAGPKNSSSRWDSCGGLVGEEDTMIDDIIELFGSGSIHTTCYRGYK